MEESYECKKCGRKVKTTDKKVPNCCGKSMKKMPLDVCTQPSHAEHARTMDSDQPCDDGRAG